MLLEGEALSGILQYQKELTRLVLFKFIAGHLFWVLENTLDTLEMVSKNNTRFYVAHKEALLTLLHLVFAFKF